MRDIKPGQLRVIDEQQIVYTVTRGTSSNLEYFERWLCILISDPNFYAKISTCQYGEFWLSKSDRLLVGN
jgi:hypothetical protein